MNESASHQSIGLSVSSFHEQFQVCHNQEHYSHSPFMTSHPSNRSYYVHTEFIYCIVFRYIALKKYCTYNFSSLANSQRRAV